MMKATIPKSVVGTEMTVATQINRTAVTAMLIIGTGIKNASCQSGNGESVMYYK